MSTFAMPWRTTTALFLLAAAATISTGCMPAGEQTGEAGRSEMLPDGPPSTSFQTRLIGDPIHGTERPRVAQVQVADLDKDGLADVIVCDALRDTVSWIRQAPRGTFTETVLASVPAPAHATPIDFDGDGDLDLVVASLGVLMPSNNRVGAVIVLENDGRQRFTPHVLVDHVGRVADAEPADLDGDGDLDIAVAGFGYDD